MGKYLDGARKLYAQSLKELGEWERTRDQTILRDAAEKAWGAVVLATNEVLEARGRRVPSGTNARRDELDALERKDRRLRGMRLRARFAAVELQLHRDCFYDGQCPMPGVRDSVTEDVKEFLDDAAELTATTRS